jgi:predicted porin
MQKKLIALAVAGLVSGAAFAQSNVTVYGVADMYYGYVKAGDLKVNPALNSGGLAGSRLGFQGAESLGNGLTAVFQYEVNMFVDSNGTGNVGTLGQTALNPYGNGGTVGTNTVANNGLSDTRQAYVGLAGGFGTVVAGRLQSPGYVYTGMYDALASSKVSPQAILSTYGKMLGAGVGGVGTGSTISPSDYARVNNAIAYLSPNFSGFSGVLAYSAGEQPTGDKEGVWALGLNYAAGPLGIGFVHHDIKNYLGVASADAKENFIGASYDLKVVKLIGSWQNAKLDLNNTTDKMYQIGAAIPAGPGSVNIAYGKTKMDRADDDAKSYTIAYLYPLSKRTTAYTAYNRTSNDANSAVGILGVGVAGEATTGFVMGLNHKF